VSRGGPLTRGRGDRARPGVSATRTPVRPIRGRAPDPSPASGLGQPAGMDADELLERPWLRRETWRPVADEFDQHVFLSAITLGAGSQFSR